MDTYTEGTILELLRDKYKKYLKDNYKDFLHNEFLSYYLKTFVIDSPINSIFESPNYENFKKSELSRLNYQYINWSII